MSGEKIATRVILAQNLDRLMKAQKKSRRDVCDDLGIKYMTLSDWLIARTYPRIDMLDKLADYFGVTRPVLTEQQRSQVVDAFEVKAIRIPVLGRVAAGIPLDAIEEIIDWEEITPEMASDGEYFALQIHGNSMEPKISDGDVVIVRKQSDADSGDVVIALIDGQEGVCKRLRKYEDGTICLMSTNPEYDPLYFTPTEQNQEPVKILGKVKELRAKF